MPEPAVIVFGSINMDVVATADHHPAVGETVLGRDLRFASGGKGGNQAVAAVRAGAPTRMVGRVGDDPFGATLRDFLASAGVDVSAVTVAAGPSGTALIVVGADGDNTIVVVPGANGTLSVDDVEATAIDSGDVVVAQYEIPMAVVEAAFAAAKRSGATTVLNPAPARPTSESLLALADIVIVNETEVAFLTGAAGDAAELAARLRSRPDQVVIATLGAAGAVVVDGGGSRAVAVRRADVVDTTGAGDCFVGALAAALCGGAAVTDAVEFATAAASISVERPGAGRSMPTRAEIEARLRGT